MKKLKYLILLVLLCTTFDVVALKRNDKNLTGRNKCATIELAKANSDGSITHDSCYDKYVDAKNAMDEREDNDLIILERINNVTKVIDAKYAVIYLDKGKSELTYLYSSSSVNSSLTYMNNYRDYGATDAAYLGLNYSNKAIKVRLGGITGWIKSGEYYLIPYNWVKNFSYYNISDSGIKHFYSMDIEEVYTQASRLLGPKPSFEIANGKYYSYDGIYLYSDYYSMIDDYRDGKHELSVNKDHPYYNYYLYLPHRSKTNYSIDDMDSYLRNVLNFKGSVYAKTKPSNYSVLYGTSEYFMMAEKWYGANALSVFSLSRNESANGTSSIAINKNNIFGHDAVDGAAYSSATGYLDVRSSIYSHGYGYINYGYARVADSRYYGSHFGNKYRGMNVMYASDVYWGEKAASFYYSFDKDNGLLDYNYYQLILSTASGVNARTAPNTSSKVAFSIKYTGLPFVLLEEVTGTTVNGNNIWYKIQADSNINSSGALIGANKNTWPHYNWDGAVYVHSSYFIKINDAQGEDGSYQKPNAIEKEVNHYEITTNATNTGYTPEVVLVNSDTDFFYSSTLLEKKGSLKKGSYLVVLEKVQYDDVTNYLVITDYSTNQKAWISSLNTELVSKDLLSINIPTSGGYINVYDKIGGSVVLKSYSGNFLPIVGKEIVNNKIYLKVEYKIVGSLLYGYVDSSQDNISWTLNYLNSPPTIEANDVQILINSSFDPMENVVGKDLEDGIITDKIEIITNTVNANKAGTYNVIYELVDSYGDKVQKSIQVIVVEPTMSDSLFMFHSLKHVSDNKFNFQGFMGVKGMDNINVSETLIFVNQITKEEYSFKMDKWDDYPYEMSSLDDKKSYNYSGGWFNSTIDLSSLDNGDYTLYIEVINGSKKARSLFTNIAYMDMTRRASGNNKEFLIDVDYSTINSPLLFSVRSSLISLDVPATMDPMFNFINEYQLDNNMLTIKGTSHNVGVDLSNDVVVERSLVLENKETFERVEMNLGSITNGDYPITLAVSDNCDKTRAWFLNTLDLSILEKGEYVLYIKNTVNNITYYGEIIDVSYTDFAKINNNKYLFSRNDDIRLRLELKVS